MTRPHRPFQLGLNVVLTIVSALSVFLALASQGWLGTALFLVAMPLWCWLCVEAAVGLSVLIDRLSRR